MMGVMPNVTGIQQKENEMSNHMETTHPQVGYEDPNQMEIDLCNLPILSPSLHKNIIKIQDIGKTWHTRNSENAQNSACYSGSLLGIGMNSNVGDLITNRNLPQNMSPIVISDEEGFNKEDGNMNGTSTMFSDMNNNKEGIENLQNTNAQTLTERIETGYFAINENNCKIMDYKNVEVKEECKDEMSKTMSCEAETNGESEENQCSELDDVTIELKPKDLVDLEENKNENVQSSIDDKKALNNIRTEIFIQLDVPKEQEQRMPIYQETLKKANTCVENEHLEEEINGEEKAENSQVFCNKATFPVIHSQIPTSDSQSSYCPKIYVIRHDMENDSMIQYDDVIQTFHASQPSQNSNVAEEILIQGETKKLEEEEEEHTSKEGFSHQSPFPYMNEQQTQANGSQEVIGDHEKKVIEGKGKPLVGRKEEGEYEELNSNKKRVHCEMVMKVGHNINVQKIGEFFPSENMHKEDLCAKSEETQSQNNDHEYGEQRNLSINSILPKSGKEDSVNDENGETGNEDDVLTQPSKSVKPEEIEENKVYTGGTYELTGNNQMREDCEGHIEIKISPSWENKMDKLMGNVGHEPLNIEGNATECRQEQKLRVECMEGIEGEYSDEGKQYILLQTYSYLGNSEGESSQLGHLCKAEPHNTDGFIVREMEQQSIDDAILGKRKFIEMGIENVAKKCKKMDDMEMASDGEKRYIDKPQEIQMGYDVSGVSNIDPTEKKRNCGVKENLEETVIENEGKQEEGTNSYLTQQHQMDGLYCSQQSIEKETSEGKTKMDVKPSKSNKASLVKKKQEHQSQGSVTEKNTEGRPASRGRGGKSHRRGKNRAQTEKDEELGMHKGKYYMVTRLTSKMSSQK